MVGGFCPPLTPSYSSKTSQPKWKTCNSVVKSLCQKCYGKKVVMKNEKYKMVNSKKVYDLRTTFCKLSKLFLSGRF